MGYLNDGVGNKSSMRLAMLMAVVTGCYTVVIATVAMLDNNPYAIAMAGIGAGMVVAAQGWKAVQHKQEGNSIDVRGHN